MWTAIIFAFSPLTFGYEERKLEPKKRKKKERKANGRVRRERKLRRTLMIWQKKKKKIVKAHYVMSFFVIIYIQGQPIWNVSFLGGSPYKRSMGAQPFTVCVSLFDWYKPKSWWMRSTFTCTVAPTMRDVESLTTKKPMNTIDNRHHGRTTTSQESSICCHIVLRLKLFSSRLENLFWVFSSALVENLKHFSCPTNFSCLNKYKEKLSHNVKNKK